MTDVENLDKLLPCEMDQMREIWFNWQQARAENRWEDADRLREQFKEWDNKLNSDGLGLWYPIFESTENRKRRAIERMRRFGVSIYPWSLDDLKYGMV